MELKEALLHRRSVRKFTDETVSAQDIDDLLHAAMSGPSACNRRPWKFHVVTNPQLLEDLRRSSRFTKMKAPLAIVVCGDLHRALPLQMADYWIQDCAAATQNILLQATDLGLGAVWCGLHPQKKPSEYVSALLKMDQKQVPMALIFLGHPAEEPAPRDQFDVDCVQFYS